MVELVQNVQMLGDVHVTQLGISSLHKVHIVLLTVYFKLMQLVQTVNESHNAHGSGQS